MSEAWCNNNMIRLQLVSVGESRGSALVVRGLRHGSLSGVPYGCARLPIHLSGGSTDGSPPLLLFCHQFPPFMCLKMPAGFVTLSCLTDEGRNDSRDFDILL